MSRKIALLGKSMLCEIAAMECQKVRAADMAEMWQEKADELAMEAADTPVPVNVGCMPWPGEKGGTE